jgi:hypothetical protein
MTLRCLAAALAAALSIGTQPALAAGADQPLSIGVGYERWTLPGHERMGMAHAQVLFEAVPDWWVGPTAYGAATGQRGGFFVGGVTAQRPVTLLPGWLWLVPSFTVGGGGGGGAPVGNGLMLRSAVALKAAVGHWRAGVALSDVRFPGAPIHSQQLALVAEWHSWFAAEPLSQLGQALDSRERSGMGVDSVALVAGGYRLRAGAPRSSVRLVGVRLDQQAGRSGWHYGVEAAAAADAPSAGYMELMAHLGRDWSLLPAVQLGVRGALGLGGGGAVPTGGGTMGHLEGTLQVAPVDGWRIGAALGAVAGRAKTLRGTRAELWLAADLEPAGNPGTPGRGGTVRRMEWAGSLQQVQTVQRKDGSSHALQTIGLQLNQWLGPNAYLTGQAHSALGGGAGAYSIGLLGAGVASTPRWGGWQIGAEALAGGAGGGGVQSLSGAIGQGLLWVGKRPEADGPHWRAGLGAARGRGGPVSPVAQIAWVVPFGQVMR